MTNYIMAFLIFINLLPMFDKVYGEDNEQRGKMLGSSHSIILSYHTEGWVIGLHSVLLLESAAIGKKTFTNLV